MYAKNPAVNITRRIFIKLLLVVGGLLSIFKATTLFASNSSSALIRKNQTGNMNKICTFSPAVVCVHSGKATRWDYASYPYVDSIEQDIVNDMLNKGVMLLTGEKSKKLAWECLFESYKKGDVIAIKPNFNDLHKEFRNNYVASPAVLNSIIEQLVEILNVPTGDIMIYDCSRNIPDSYRNRIKYPVKFIEPYGSSFMRKVIYRTIGNPLPEADMGVEIKMTHDIKNKKGEMVKCYLPKVITDADHLINVPILKSHQFVLASGALKNHYGTVRFSDGHKNPEYLHPPIIHESIADINEHAQLREKTRLIVMDALFGRIKKKGGYPDKWKIFDNNDPNRLFLSCDPVALDSVTSFFIKKELSVRNEDYYSDDYLRMASDKNIGIYEIPEMSEDFSKINFRHYDL